MYPEISRFAKQVVSLYQQTWGKEVQVEKKITFVAVNGWNEGNASTLTTTTSTNNIYTSSNKTHTQLQTWRLSHLVEQHKRHPEINKVTWCMTFRQTPPNSNPQHWWAGWNANRNNWIFRKWIKNPSVQHNCHRFCLLKCVKPPQNLYRPSDSAAAVRNDVPSLLTSHTLLHRERHLLQTQAFNNRKDYMIHSSAQYGWRCFRHESVPNKRSNRNKFVTFCTTLPQRKHITDWTTITAQR